MISLLENKNNAIPPEKLPHPFVLSFYKIAYKPNLIGKFKYGQQFFDFAEGGLCFSAPNQVKDFEEDSGDHSGFALFIHPDFFLTYPLAKKIKQYGFFSYSLNEALHLTESEKKTIISVIKMINKELKSRIDDFSQDILISQLELLLNHISRFYKRQFITRKVTHSNALNRLEELLDAYFRNEISLKQGLPTVRFLSEQLCVSPSYLSYMLRTLLGQNTQQYIHSKLIEKAKEKLSITNLSISEIAYDLGFGHSQSFSKLFKKKTALSPGEFRRSLN